MGFLNFLKPKKKEKGSEPAASQQLPPLPTESDFYSELPNLPEAPETSGLQEMEFPQPIKGMEELDLPEDNIQRMPEPRKGIGADWLKKEEYLPNELPEIPKLPAMEKTESPLELNTGSDAPWLNIPAEAPELKLFQPEERSQGRMFEPSGLISRNNNFFLESEDFKLVRGDLDKISKSQKKHHSLTEIKKEESGHYDRINSLTEEMQRKLMHIDRTLFE